MKGGCINWTPSSDFTTGDNPPSMTIISCTNFYDLVVLLRSGNVKKKKKSDKS
jgi:hypothetical protein